MNHSTKFEWDKLNKIKFMLAKAESERLVIISAIATHNMHTHYKTIKYMKTDLHNKTVNIRNLKKDLRNVKLL